MLPQWQLPVRSMRTSVLKVVPNEAVEKLSFEKLAP